MKRFLLASAATAMAVAGAAHAAPPEGAGPPAGVPKGPPAGVTQGPPAGVGASMGVGADVSGAAKTGAGASAVLPHTRASETGVEHGSQAGVDLDSDDDGVAARAAARGNVDTDGDGLPDRIDTDDDGDGILDVDDSDTPDVSANMGIGGDVSAAARSGGGAAAVLPHTRASETGVMHGSASSAADIGTDASVTLRGKARGRADTDGDGIVDHRDPDANGNGVLDINE